MLPEAVIIASAQLVVAVTELIKTAMEGQTADQKAQMWQWYIEDVKAWRKFWGVGD